MENRKKNIGVLGAFALSVGTSIGWGSFVVTGSDYLSKAGLLICGVYKRSPVFRIGGDEFVVLIEGDDYDNREKLYSQLRRASLDNTASNEGVVIAVGMAVKEEDDSFHDVFHRADEEMYAHKRLLKERRPSHNLR